VSITTLYDYIQSQLSFH